MWWVRGWGETNNGSNNLHKYICIVSSTNFSEVFLAVNRGAACQVLPPTVDILHFFYKQIRPRDSMGFLKHAK